MDSRMRQFVEKHIYQEVDGFYVFSPSDCQGSLDEYSLSCIIEILREKNKPWEKEIEDFFNDCER